jgi:hypothetical protein
MTGDVEPKDTRDTTRRGGRPTPPRPRGARNSQATPVPIGIDPTAPIPEPVATETIDATVAVAGVIPPDFSPRTVRTQAAYRQLVSSGFSGAEAAGVIGFVSGLSTKESAWTMVQVNRLLFLRSLYNETAWGRTERKAAD